MTEFEKKMDHLEEVVQLLMNDRTLPKDKKQDLIAAVHWAMVQAEMRKKF